jgi:hypothetical protein
MGCGASADAEQRSKRDVYTVRSADPPPLAPGGVADDLASNQGGDPLCAPNGLGFSDPQAMENAEEAHWQTFAQHHSDAASGGAITDEPGAFSMGVSRTATVAVARVRHGIDSDPEQFQPDPIPPVTIHEAKKRVSAWLSAQRRCSIRSSATASWVSIPDGVSPSETHTTQHRADTGDHDAPFSAAEPSLRAAAAAADRVEPPGADVADHRSFRVRSISTTSATLLPGGLVGVPAIGTTQLTGQPTDRDRSAIFAFSIDSAGMNDRSTSIMDGAAILACIAETEKRRNSGIAEPPRSLSASGGGEQSLALTSSEIPMHAQCPEPPRLTEALLYQLQSCLADDNPTEKHLGMSTMMI